MSKNLTNQSHCGLVACYIQLAIYNVLLHLAGSDDYADDNDYNDHDYHSVLLLALLLLQLLFC